MKALLFVIAFAFTASTPVLADVNMADPNLDRHRTNLAQPATTTEGDCAPCQFAAKEAAAAKALADQYLRNQNASTSPVEATE